MSGYSPILELGDDPLTPVENAELREAVEALKRGISRCESYERINLHGTTQSARKAGTLHNALFDMREALAALQKENLK